MASNGARRIDAHAVRRAHTSLLVTPTAASGTAGMASGAGMTAPCCPPDPLTGMAKPWREALHLPVAEEMPILADFFGSLEWWRLRPAPIWCASSRAMRTRARGYRRRGQSWGLALVYSPAESSLELDLKGVQESVGMKWFNPATGNVAATANKA